MMDQSKNRPSRPRIRAHNSTTARILVFDQNEQQLEQISDTNNSDNSGNIKMESDNQNPQQLPTNRLLATPKIDGKEVPVKPGLFFCFFKILFSSQKKNYKYNL